MIGVIGGSGLYALNGLVKIDEVNPSTPWGYPSAPIVISLTSDGSTRIAFLSRHSIGHTLNPSEVPSRANIAALKHLGCQVILSFSAVGSLREEIEPKHFIIPNQIIDRTKGIRPSTFFEDGIVAHASFADPFDSSLRSLIWSMRDQFPEIIFHKDKTLVCMEGPAFSTRAESNMYRAWGGDLINMSAKAKLAREAEIPYVMICMSTDYDAWRESEEGVNVAEVMKTMEANSEHAKQILLVLIERMRTALEQNELVSVTQLEGSMKFASCTSDQAKSTTAVAKLEYLFKGRQ